MTRVPANVKRGAELLDTRLPGWRERVNPDTLDLGSHRKCVVGQVLGDYIEGTDLLGLPTNRDAARYGFTTQARQTFASPAEPFYAEGGEGE